MDSRIAAGIVGLVLALLIHLVARRLRERIAPPEVLPEGFAATIAASLFGAVGLILLASGTAQMVFDQARGAGGTLSGAIFALAIAAFYALGPRSCDPPKSNLCRDGDSVAGQLLGDRAAA